MKRSFLVPTLVACFLAGIALQGPGNVLAEQELTVSAAASLTNAFPEIGKQFGLIADSRDYPFRSC